MVFGVEPTPEPTNRIFLTVTVQCTDGVKNM